MNVALFWASLVMSVASFCLFAAVLIAALRAKPGGGGMEAAPHKGIAPGDAGDLAGAFGKAGPAATAAALSVFFLFVALLVSGIVKVAVDTGAGG